MKIISDTHAQILHQRAVEAAGALVDAEILHENGEIDDYYYTSFKRYFFVRTHLDKLTAITNIDFQVSQTEKHLKTYILAASKSLPKSSRFDIASLQKQMLEGAFFIYAFRFNDYQPIGVVTHYQTETAWKTVSGVIKSQASQGYEDILKQVEDVFDKLKQVDNFTYF